LVIPLSNHKAAIPAAIDTKINPAKQNHSSRIELTNPLAHPPCNHEEGALSL